MIRNVYFLKKKYKRRFQTQEESETYSKINRKKKKKRKKRIILKANNKTLQLTAFSWTTIHTKK